MNASAPNGAGDPGSQQETIAVTGVHTTRRS